MNRVLSVALGLGICLTGFPRLLAQAPAGSDAAPTGQVNPSGQSQTPPSPSHSSANPFPEDTSTVPVLPSKTTTATPEGTYYGPASAELPLLGDDLDPVRSPDDPAPPAPSGADEGSSSSLAGLENLLPRPEDDQPSKKRKLAVVKQPTHEEAASKEIEVGDYYLQTQNWKGALSRFESALVLDPENPDVYWGLAEANRHLGNLADARANYEKVALYDPDSRHGKDARKALKEPEIANGKNAAPSASAAEAPK